jgi:hypothetical protein
MSFVRKQVDTESGFGQELRELRELRGWSSDQLSKTTGIPLFVIQSLEEERLEELRDPSYVERHVRSMVKALDGRVSYFLHKYRMLLEREGHKHGSEQLNFLARLRKSSLFVPSKYFLLLVPLPLALIVGWYVWRQADDLASVPRLEVTAPAENAAVADPQVTVTGLTNPMANVMVNGAPAVVQADGQFKIQISVPRGTTKLTVVARRRYGNQSQLVRYITYNPEYAPAVLDTKTLRPATTTANTTGTNDILKTKDAP